MTEGIWVLLGALLGALITATGPVVTAFVEDKLQRRPDPLVVARKQLLTKMLQDQRFEWRNLSTLAHVIGADADTTKCLLMEIGARASESGSEKWGLISRNPLPSVE